MIDPASIVKDYRSAGSVSEHVNLHSFIGEGVLLTKTRDIVVVLKAQLPDSEGLTPDQLAAHSQAVASAMRTFNELYRVSTITIKRNRPDIAQPLESSDPVVQETLGARANHLRGKAAELYSVDTYYAIVYEGARSRRHRRTPGSARNWLNFLKSLLSAETSAVLISDAIVSGTAALSTKVGSFIVQLQDVMGLQVASNDEAFILFRQMLNFDRDKADASHLQHDRWIDYSVAGSEIECHRDHLLVGDQQVKVLTLRELPATTYANMLRPLLELPAEMVIASEFRPVDDQTARRLIKRAQRHAFSTKTSLSSNLDLNGDASHPADQLVDESKIAIVGQLNEALIALELTGCSFGQFTLTVILHGDDPPRLARSVAGALKAVAAKGGALHEERYNLFNAFMAAIPGGTRYNLRSLYLPTECYADMLLMYAPASGEPVDPHLGRECLAVLETREKSLFHFSLHYLDLAHMAILGGSGSGKSFFMNFLLSHAQKYSTKTVVFDIGGSYRWLTRVFNGSYLEMGEGDRAYTINPFCLEPTQANLQFLFSLVKVLIESSEFRMTDQDEREIFTQIRSLYHLEPPQRRLKTLIHVLPRHLEQPLRRWTEGGQYGHVFDNAEDTLTFARFQTFEFGGMQANPQILEPLLFYVLHRTTAEFVDPSSLKTFKVCALDEAWQFARNPTVKQYITGAFKTWRKCNAAMWLATQSAGDLSESGMLQVVADNCPTQMFLANPLFDRQRYRETFRLNEAELDLIGGLTPKRQMLLKRPDLAKVLELTVSNRDYWIYSSNPRDNDLKCRTFDRLGLEQGLDYLENQKRAHDPASGVYQ